MNFIEIINLVKDLFVENLLWQIIWLIAFLVSVYNFLFCKNKKFIVFTMIASGVWWIHFYSLGLLSAAFVNSVDVIKNALALKYKKSFKIASLFMIFYIIIWYFTYSWFIWLIPIITWVLSTFLVFYVRWIWLNLGFMWIVMMWMVYNFVGQSIWWLSTDIVILVSWIIWVARIILEEKRKKRKKLKKKLEKNIKKDVELI